MYVRVRRPAGPQQYDNDKFSHNMTTDFSTPVLDTISMASFSTPEALAEALHRACTIDGFIYVKDHGITQAEIDAVFGLSADFFTNAPESEKSFVNLKENVGYTAV